MELFSDSWGMRSDRADNSANVNQGQVPLPPQNPSKRKAVMLDEGREDNSEAVLDRRLTIHCIVEEISSLDENSWKECPHNCRIPNKSARENSKWWHCECRNIVMNSCVVIKASTGMSDLVKTVLVKLGYPSIASSSAAGSILIRNWRALSLSTICPNPKMTVGDVLGELSSLVTLQIQILRPKSAFVQEIKDKLLSFLIAKGHGFLSSSGCPLDLFMLSKLCEESTYFRKHMKEESSEEMQQRFESWLNHVQKSESYDREMNHFPPPTASNNETNNNITGNINAKMNSSRDLSGKTNCSSSSSGGGGSNIPGSNSVSSTSSAHSAESPPQIISDNECMKFNSESDDPSGKKNPSFEAVERSLHCAQTKTRMRTSFDPDLELPKLLKWYLENPHPTRQQIHEYVMELNSLESRRGRKKLDVNNVVYWFKNARAAQKRSEYRKFCNISVPGAKKNSNLLKIPLGKTSSSVTSEEHITLSDDEPCPAPENVHTFHNDKGKCMQVLGNWNSNGAGEAVLEMRISPPKPSQTSSPVKIEEDHPAGHEDSSEEGILSIAEESRDNSELNSADENRSGDINEMNGGRKSFEKMSANEDQLKFRKTVEEMVPGSDRHSNDKYKDEMYSTKVRSKSLVSQKKLNGFNHSETSLLSRYKTASQNSVLRHSFMYMSQCMNAKLNNNLSPSADERRKRNRTFIDPLTEVPRLEQWFQLSTHPSHSLIVRYTEELNGMPYRKKFPKLETKNVQFWFKNRRAKNKRLNYMDTNNFLR